MTKALHLLSDPKFADAHIARFNDTTYENRFVLLVADFTYTGPNLRLLEWVVPFSTEYDVLKKAAGSFDLVFVYNLDYIKSCFINEITPDVPVFWHLYGTELYNNYEPLRYSIYSDVTKKILQINWLTIRLRRVRKLLGRIRNKILHRRADYDETRLAIKRTSYLAWYSKEEYEFLQASLNFKLPPFLPLSVWIQETPVPVLLPALAGAIWLGNSASPENNHLDILDVLEKVSFGNKIVMPFSYSQDKRYNAAIKAVRKSAILNIDLLESFADYQLYCQMLASCRAAIFNSYRQMALANIFIALKAGLKVYMNELNPSFLWLNNHGFCLYSIQENLVQDLRNNQLDLTPVEKEINQNAYAAMISPGNNKVFLESLAALVRPVI